jgi:hypothetical protein
VLGFFLTCLEKIFIPKAMKKPLKQIKKFESSFGGGAKKKKSYICMTFLYGPIVQGIEQKFPKL